MTAEHNDGGPLPQGGRVEQSNAQTSPDAVQKGPKSRETTMGTVGSTLAVMAIEDHLQKGGTLRFLAEGVDVTITRDDLKSGGQDGS